MKYSPVIIDQWNTKLKASLLKQCILKHAQEMKKLEEPPVEVCEDYTATPTPTPDPHPDPDPGPDPTAKSAAKPTAKPPAKPQKPAAAPEAPPAPKPASSIKPGSKNEQTHDS